VARVLAGRAWPLAAQPAGLGLEFGCVDWASWVRVLGFSAGTGYGRIVSGSG
jgi:hypothetical protein